MTRKYCRTESIFKWVTNETVNIREKEREEVVEKEKFNIEKLSKREV